MQSNPSEARKEGIAAPDMKSLAGLGLIVLAAVYFYVLAGKIDENPIPGQLGPAFWPRMMLVLLIAGCGLKALEVFRGGGKGVADIVGSGPPMEVNRIKLWAMIAMVLGVVYFLDILGFALANFIFLLLFMRIAGVRRVLPLVLISLVGTVALLYLFVKVVYIPLPKGQWFFDDLTILLYRFLRII
jgi:hypothetical protein